MLTTEQQNAANIARLKQIASDADAKKAEFADAGDKISAAHYAGMRDGLLRAVTVLEGRG
jgi:hypothetical protein